MFNLEQAIADWRQRMLAAGIETPVPLEELELHLREEIERQTEAGMDAAKAFEEAAQSIGDARSLKTEFKKVPEKPRAKFFRIAGALIYLYLSVGFIYMPLTDIGSIIHFSRRYISGGSSFDLLLAVTELLCGMMFLAMGIAGCRYAWQQYRNNTKLLDYRPFQFRSSKRP